MMHHVEIPSGGKMLRGMLHLPGGRPPHAGVMLCHGFTGQRMESHFLFVTIARRLEAAGLAALRFDFAGSGESDGEFIDMTVSAEVQDAAAALDFLRRHPAVDPGRIGAAGLSLGGCVTALLAGRRRGDLRAAALMAAVGDTRRAAAGLRTEAVEKQLAERGCFDLSGLKVGKAFYEDFVRHDPVAAMTSYPGPVLIIHGSADAAVPVGDAHLYHQARTGASASTRLEILTGADHTFNNVEHTAAVCGLLAEFFAENLKGRA
jgi:hypothetical protein